MAEREPGGHERALRRLLASGPLTGWPRRPADQEMLVAIAASLFEALGELPEREVNARLGDWLATFCAPYGIDHVTMRRALVDRGFLLRDRAGSTYRADPERIAESGAGAGAAHPGRILREAQEERESRKRARPGPQPTEEAMTPKTPTHSHEHDHEHEHTHEHVHRHGDLVHSHPHAHRHVHPHGHAHSHEGGHEHAGAGHPHAHVPEAHDHAHDDLGGAAHERAPHDHEHG